MDLGKVAPGGSGGEGNTKVSPPKRLYAAKRWGFTLNNYTEKDVGSIKSMVKMWCKFGQFGYEVGDSGTKHLQGYVELLVKDRPLNKKFGLPKTIHWFKCKGSKEENVVYTSKDGEVWTWPLPYTIDIKLTWWETKLLEVLQTVPDDRSIYWVWEETGCAGKTVFQKWYFLNGDKRTVTLSGKASDMKNGIVKYKETNGVLPEVVFVNIPKVSGTHVSIAGIEQIKDMWFYSGKYEGGMVCGPNPHVMIFANEPAPDGVLSSDRLKQVFIGTGTAFETAAI